MGQAGPGLGWGDMVDPLRYFERRTRVSVSQNEGKDVTLYIAKLPFGTTSFSRSM